MLPQGGNRRPFGSRCCHAMDQLLSDHRPQRSTTDRAASADRRAFELSFARQFKGQTLVERLPPSLLWITLDFGLSLVL